MSRVRSLLVVLPVAAGLALSGCSSTVSEPDAGAFSSPSPSSSTPPPSVVPLPSPGANLSFPVSTDPLGPDMPSFAEVDGFTSGQVESAYKFASRFVQQNLYPLALWHDKYEPEEGSAYTWPATHMTMAAMEKWLPAAAGESAEGIDREELVTSPPDIAGVWAFPAVAGIRAQNPSVKAGDLDTTTGKKTLVLSMPVTAVAVYEDNGSWYAMPVEKDYVLRLAPRDSSDGGWEIVGWEGSDPAKFGAADKLDAQPEDRTLDLPDLPE